MNVRKIAIDFIKTLNPFEKEALKLMLKNGVVCGADFAKKNKIEPEALTNELKLIFGGK